MCPDPANIHRGTSVRTNTDSGRLLVGLLVVVVGLWLLLSNLDVLDLGAPWRWFPSVLWIMGIWTLVRTGFRQIVGPLILIVVGVAVQIAVLNDIPNQIRTAIWPILIIAAGLVIVLRGSFRRRDAAATSSASDFSAFAAFYGTKQRIGGDLRRGQITAIFGGAEIDLRDAQVSRPPALLDVTCMFGGAEIRAPDAWNIRNDVLALFGGVSDERRGDADASGPVQLSIQGVVLFGGLTIKD